MERRISTLILLCLALSGVGAINVVIPQAEYEYPCGDNITLPCTFTPKPGFTPPLVVISWSIVGVAANAEELLILTYYHPTKVTDIKKMYEGRVSIDVDINSGKADLKLNAVTLQDNKNFECRVQIPGDDEGKPAADTRLVVRAFSGVCALNVVIPQAEYEYPCGDNITLPCTFTPKPGSTPPLIVISWSIVGIAANAEELLILTYHHPTKVTTVKKKYEGRASIDVDINAGKANLKLNAVTLQDNKNFECRVQIPGDDEGKPAANTSLVVRALSGVGAINVVIPQAEYEYTCGDNITLPCTFTPMPCSTPPLVIISWSVEGVAANAQELLIITYYHPPNITDVEKKYEGRASIDVDINAGKANLKLNAITLQDNKNFECRVQIPGDDEGKQAANTRLVVLALSGVGALNVGIPQPEYMYTWGDNITLPCTFTPMPCSTPPLIIISWSIEGVTANAEELLILTYYHPNKVTDVEKKYEDRVSIDVDINAGKANLKLNAITPQDNKNFECRVQIPGDDAGKQAANTRLVVRGSGSEIHRVPSFFLLFLLLFFSQDLHRAN